MRRWLLPEHLEDILPPEARAIERLRGTILDRFNAWGYELVIPPLLEHLDSLLTGTGHDLDLATFKLVDQLSGRTLGVRADHTPQVARIDAHLLNRRGVSRLCYCGSVLHTLPAALTKTREPLQIGAELYGHAGLEADIEVLRLMIESLRVAGIGPVHVDIGHSGVFRALAYEAGSVDRDLIDAVQRKDAATVRALAVDRPTAAALAALPRLYGSIDILDQAKEWLPSIPAIDVALAALRTVSQGLASDDPQLTLGIDLAELSGFNYENGIVFAAYTPGCPDALARGGRYDEVGAAFGNPRPATGFTLDLRQLARVVGMDREAPGILAPWSDDPALHKAVARLRAAGQTVVSELPGTARHRAELHCDRQLVPASDGWRVEPLNS
jgi:ATP phosphoribosyltransferase regulatory subunit